MSASLEENNPFQSSQDEEEGDEEAEEEDQTDEEEEEEDTEYRVDTHVVEMTPECWTAHKLVKYLRAGTSNVTLIALVGLKELGFQVENTQLALKTAGGIEILLNILRTDALFCVIGSLQVLEMACKHSATRMSIHQLGGVQLLQELLSHCEIEVRALSASVLSKVCTFRTAGEALIRGGGIPILVLMLFPKGRNLTAVEHAARALWACSVSKTGRSALMDSKLPSAVGNLLSSQNKNVLIPVVGILQRCFLQASFRNRMESLGHTSYLISFLQSPSLRLQCLAAQALARATRCEATRSRLVEENGLIFVVKLLKEESRIFISETSLPPKHPVRKVSLQGALLVETIPDIKEASQTATSGGPGEEPGTAESISVTTGDQGQPAKTDDDPKDGKVKQEKVEKTTKADKPEKSSGEVDKQSEHSAPAQTPPRKRSSLRASFSTPAANKLEHNRDICDDEPSDGTMNEDDLLEAVTGILWQVSKSEKHLDSLQKLEAVPIMMVLLMYFDERIVTNVAGALGEVALIEKPCNQIVQGQGITHLLELLQRSSNKLLLNVIHALDSCARNPEALNHLLSKEGLRLLWSHLKSSNHKIQAAAANAICTCLSQENEGLSEVVRSLVGGIELLVALLESPNETVLSSVCAAISRIAADPQNLAIMTDYGAVTCLSKLAVRSKYKSEENDTLRPYLAEAIAACCVSRETGLLFGQAGAVAPLVQYLETVDSKIRRPTCRALHRLSLEPENCVTLHQSGAVDLLLDMLCSEDEVVQEAAADCLRNIRMLALQRCKDRDTDKEDVFCLRKNPTKQLSTAPAYPPLITQRSRKSISKLA